MTSEKESDSRGRNIINALSVTLFERTEEMNNDEFLVFPFEMGKLKEIKIRKITHGDIVLLTDDGQVVRELLLAGVSLNQINECATKFDVDFEDQTLSITTDNDHVKMAKDKILQTMLLLATR